MSPNIVNYPSRRQNNLLRTSELEVETRSAHQTVSAQYILIEWLHKRHTWNVVHSCAETSSPNPHNSREWESCYRCRNCGSERSKALPKIKKEGPRMQRLSWWVHKSSTVPTHQQLQNYTTKKVEEKRCLKYSLHLYSLILVGRKKLFRL